jgi:hypothetical protein
VRAAAFGREEKTISALQVIASNSACIVPVPEECIYTVPNYFVGSRFDAEKSWVKGSVSSPVIQLGSPGNGNDFGIRNLVSHPQIVYINMYKRARSSRARKRHATVHIAGLLDDSFVFVCGL